METRLKRFLSLALAIMMVFSMMPQITLGASAASATTLYCVAPDGWTNCNVYYWGGSSQPQWPGEAMTKGSDGIWSYEVPSDSTNVIFNNGSAQTKDLTMPTDDKVQYNYTSGTWSAYGASVEAPEVKYVTVYCNASWSNVNVYWWGSEIDNPSWPGLAMSKGEDGLWKYAIPGDATNLIFNNGSTQTDDLTAPTGTNVQYDVAAKTWGSYTPVVEEEVVPVVTLNGTFNDWSGVNMTVNGSVATYTMELEADTYEFKIVEDGTWMGNGGTIEDTTETTSPGKGWEFKSSDDSNCTLTATGGTYTFAYDVSTNFLIVTHQAPAPAAPATDDFAELGCSDYGFVIINGNNPHVTVGEVTWNNGVYTCPVTIDQDSLAAQGLTLLNEGHEGYTHTAPAGMTGTATITATWNAENEKWKYEILTYTFTCTEIVEPAISGTFNGALINKEKAERTFISAELKDVYAKKSVVLKLYDAQDTLLATTSLVDHGDILGNEFGTLSMMIGINCTDSYWDTKWEEGKLRADFVPAKATLYVDGTEMNTAVIQMRTTSGETAINWADVPGVPAVPVNYVAYIGEQGFESLVEAAEYANQQENPAEVEINVPADISEPLSGKTLYGKIVTDNPAGVTITDSVNDNYVNAVSLTIGAGVTLNAKYFYFYSGEYVVEGTLKSNTTLYISENADVIVRNGGKIECHTLMHRLNTEADAGIYIYGDNSNDTVEVTINNYLANYSGLFYAKDAIVNAGYILLTANVDEAEYAAAYMELDNTIVTIVGASNTSDRVNMNGDVVLTLKNGSKIADVRDMDIASGINLTLNVDETSSIHVQYPVIAEDVPFKKVDNGDGTYGIAEVTKEISGNLGTVYVQAANTNGNNTDRNRLYGEIKNVYAKKSVVIKVYSGETLISTTNLTDKYTFPYEAATLGVNVVISGSTSSSWNTVWEDGMPRADLVPDKAVLYIDGTEMNTATVTLNGIDNLGTPTVWETLPGVNPDPNAPVIYEVSTKAELDAALAAAKDGDTIKLLADIDCGSAALKIEDAITLDLGGKTLTTSGRNYSLSLHNDGIVVTNGKLVHAGTVAAIKVYSAAEISNLNIDVTGTSSSGNPIGGIVIQQNSAGVDTIKNVNIYSTAGQGIANGIETHNCGNATEPVIGSMENVTVNAKGNALNISAPVGTAKNCSFTGGESGIEIWIKGTYSATLDLVDCDVVGGVYAHDEGNETYNNDGTLKLTVDSATTGASAEDVTLSLAVAENVEGVLADVKDNAVAKVGYTYYLTLADAVTAAESGATIILMPGTHKLESSFTDKELTFTSQEGKKAETVMQDAYNNNYQFHNTKFHFENLTIIGDVTVNEGLHHSVEATYKNCDINGIRYLFSENVSFEDCVFNSAGEEHAFWTYGASNVTVTGCTFNYTDRAVNCYSDAGAEHETDITFTDCTFNYTGTADASEGAVEINSSSSKSIDLVMDGCTAPAKGDMWFISQWDSKDGANTTVYVDSVKVWPEPVYVAQIGDTKFESFADAVNAAVDGDTIELISGENVISLAGNVAGGKTVTITGTAIVDWTKGNLMVGRGGEGDGKVIFDGANITSSVKKNPASTGIHVSGSKASDNTVNNGVLVIKNSTIELDYLINRNETVVEGNSNLTVYGGCYTHGRNASESGITGGATANLTIEAGSTVTVVNENGMGVGGEGNGIMTVKGTYNANVLHISSIGAVNVEGGNLNIDGTVTNNGELKFTDANLTDVTIEGSGTTRFYNNVNFYGTNVVHTTGINGTPFNLIVNKGATLDITRFVLGYGREITVYGEIEDAHTFDPTGKTPSLKFNSTSGVSIGGTDTGALTVQDAYVVLGSSSWKNSQSINTWSFKNSYVSATSFGDTKAGYTDSAEWNVTFDDSVLEASTYIKNGEGVTYNFINGTVATANSSMTIRGELNIDETSSVTVKGYFNNVVGAMGEHDGISGAVNVDGKLNIAGNGAVELIGGELKIGKSGKVELTNCSLTVDADSKLIIDGEGRVAGEYTGIVGTVVNNGTIEVINNDLEASVNENGVIVLTEKVFEAQIGEKKYETLSEALTVVQDNETIILLADVTVNGVTIDENITIDLNEKTMTLTPAWGASAVAINGSLTIKGNGEVVVAPAMFGGNGFKVNTGATLTIDGGKYSTPANAVAASIGSVDGTLVINGGTFGITNQNAAPFGTGANATITIKDGEFNLLPISKKDEDTRTISVSGGTFTAEVPEEWIAQGYICEEVDGKYVITTAPVAMVGTTKYGTIEEAIAAWTNGTTLTLLANVTLSDVIVLKSTEYHILDLGTYTMTAASKKDAIQIENCGRGSASWTLDIKADATNPGGITATGKAIVRTAGKSGVKDRPIIRFYGGVFNASNIVYHSGSNGTNCPQFYFYGGDYTGTIYTNRTLNQFHGGTFHGSLMMSVDSSAYTLINGGTFKQLSNLYMSALNSDKFTIGSAKGTYDREVYINDDGYYVVAAAKPAEAFEAAIAKNPGTNDYLKYSKVAAEGKLNYTDVYVALDQNKSASVIVYVDSLDLTGTSFKGTLLLPAADSTLTVTFAEGTTPAWKVDTELEGYVATYTESVADGTVTRVYKLVKPVAQIGDIYYETFETALNAVEDGETITLIEDATGSEISKEIDFTKAISFTITGKAPEYALPVVTFQNTTVTIKDAEILTPELDARQNATINVVDSIVYDAGGNSIIKSYYNGAINISGTSVVYTMQVTTMGYITVSDTAKLNATWQTNVYGNGLITVKDDATFATGALQLTGKEYSGRDNTDAERVGKPATIVVDGATMKVGEVYSSSGADYSYNADGYGINIGTISGKAALLDIKNSANVTLRMQNGGTVNVGADGTVNVNGSTFNVTCRGEGTVTLNNSNIIQVTGESTLNIPTLSGTELNLLHGAVIKDSTVGGEAMLYGNVTFRGDNTFAMLYDYGNAYSTEYAAWTVEKGASVTLTEKARYGLGYGDKVTIYGNLEDALTARENLTAEDASLFTHGLVAMSNWDVNNSLSVKNAYVIIGSNNSFGNSPKSGHVGTFEFNFENTVLDASRITFYKAASKTNFNFNGSDVKVGTFMTRDDDSIFTLTNTKLVSTTTFNGTDEGNYHAGELVLNNSSLSYAAPLVMENGTLTLGAGSSLTAPSISGTGKLIIDATGMTAGPAPISGDASGFTGTIEVVGNDELYAAIDENGNIVLIQKVFVAQIGETKYESFEAAIAAACADSTITRIDILCDYTQDTIAVPGETYTMLAGQNLTIGADKAVTVTLSRTAGESFSIYLYEGNSSLTIEENVTIEGLDIVANGFATSGNNTTINGNIKAMSLKQWTSNGEIVINGKVELGYGDGQFDLAYGNGTVTVNGKGDKTAPQFKAGYSGSRGNGNTLNLNNTYFESGAWFTLNGSNVTVNLNNSLLAVSGGDAAGCLTIGAGNVVNVGAGSEIKAGTINGAGKIVIDAAGMTAGEVTIITGTVADTLTVEVINNDALEASIVDGKIILTEKKAVAKIGDTTYPSLQAAIDKAEKDDVVVLLEDLNIADVELSTLDGKYNTLFKVAGKKITVDLNEKTISGAYSGTDMLVGVFSTEDDGHLTLTGNGTINVTATNTVYALLVNYDETSTLTVENGTYTLDAASDSLVYSGSDETATINGGTYTLGNVGTGKNGSPWIFNAKGQNTANIIVNAGTFNADIFHQYYPFEVLENRELALKNNGDGTWTIVDAVAYVGETEGAYIHEVGYATLEEAVAAADVGGEVTILKAGTYNVPAGKDLIITGAVDGVVFDNIGAKNMGGANVTFNNVTFNYASDSTYKGLQHSGDLVYNNCTINGQVFLYGTSETFNNCTFNTTDAANYNVWTYGAKEVAFNECTFNCAGKSVLVYNEGANHSTDLTVTDCDFIASAPVEGKAAIEIDTSPNTNGKSTVAIDGETTATGFATGSVSGETLWNDKKNQANIDVYVDNVQVWPKRVAAIGETYYSSLQAAIDAAVKDDTIILLEDITENVTLNKSVTIDGADKNYTGNISISGTSTAATVKNVNFIGGDGYAITTNRIKSITVENCTATGYDYGFLYANKSTPTVVVKNVEVSNVNYGFHWVYGTTATLENVKMTDVAYGIMVQNHAAKTVTLTGCEISGTNPIYVWEKATATQTFNFVGENKLTDTDAETAISTYAKLVLTEETATLAAAEGLNVTTSVADRKVVYEDGIYSVKEMSYGMVAMIGETYFETVDAAIKVAVAGDTIVLVNDARETALVMLNGIDLDLAGHNLTVESHVAAFAGNNIIDTVGGGLLKVQNNVLIQATNTYLPIWDAVNGGYAFAGKPAIDVLQTNPTNSSVKYTFLPYLDIEEYALLAQGIETSGVTLKVRVSWTSSNGMSSETSFKFTDDLMQAFYNSYNPESGKFGQAFTLTLNGTDSVSDLAFQVYFESDLGVVLTCN